MTYTDASEYLRIAANAYRVEAYGEAADILGIVAPAVAFDRDMAPGQRNRLIAELRIQTGRFQFCPDECAWESVSALNDLFRE